MVKALKQLIRRLPFYHHLKNKWRGLFIDREIKEWERKGRSGPPPHKVKQETILAYAQERKIATLVESGTFQGDMVEATKRSFSAIYSIELSPALCDAAKRRFRNDKNVKIVQGDSGAEMKK